MGKLREFGATVTVDAGVAEVVEVLTAVHRWPSWNDSVTSVDRRGPGPLSAGEQITVKQPRLPAARWTVTDVDGTGFAWVSTSFGIHNTGDHRVTLADGGGAVVVLTLTMSGPLAGVTSLLLGGLVRRYVRLEADGLRREVERRRR